MFTAIGVRSVKTPVQAPRANAIAERWIASAHRECLDQILITSEQHLQLVLGEYADQGEPMETGAWRRHPPMASHNKRC